ncbi:MAG: site-specific integrase [Desulfobacterales bacterium]|nr:site-specific integrase [Desulfobacterales bacterium]
MSPKDFVSLKIGQAYIKEDLARDEARIYIERRGIKEMTRTQVFFDLEATKALKDYLRYRRDKLDEKITDETPLVRSEHATEAGEVEAITTGQLGRLVSEIGERAGVKITPKIFRKYFRTQCGNSIGRKNEHILIMGGWKIPGAGPNYQYPSKEEMLDDYIKSEPFLRFQKPQAEESEEERNLRTLKDIARSLNMDPLEVFKRKTKDKPLTMQEKREALLAEITFVKQRMRTEPAGGGLAYTQALAKELGKVIADAIRETKEQLKQQ